MNGTEIRNRWRNWVAVTAALGAIAFGIWHDDNHSGDRKIPASPTTLPHSPENPNINIAGTAP